VKITVEVDGVVFIVEGDDDDRVIAAAMKVGRREKLTPSDGVVMSNSPDANPWLNFIERIGDKPDQLRVLRLVKQQGPYALNQLADLLEFESTLELGGLLGAIRRTTLRAGFATTDEVLAKKGRFYLAGPALVANELPPVVSTTTRYDRINETEEDDA
jgi:hypothetical protein